MFVRLCVTRCRLHPALLLLWDCSFLVTRASVSSRAVIVFWLLQPFSQNPALQQLQKSSKSASMYDPAEDDLELFYNS